MHAHALPDRAPTAPDPEVLATAPEAPADPSIDRLVALFRQHPGQRDELAAAVQADHGNGVVAQVMDRLLTDEVGEVEPDVVEDRDATGGAPKKKPKDPPFNLADAEAHNRHETALVVQFDRATHGKYAKINGELDAVDVALFQKSHGLPANGKVDNNTVRAAQGKPIFPDPEPEPDPTPTWKGPPRVTIQQPVAKQRSPRPFPIGLVVDVEGKEGTGVDLFIRCDVDGAAPVAMKHHVTLESAKQTEEISIPHPVSKAQHGLDSSITVLASSAQGAGPAVRVEFISTSEGLFFDDVSGPEREPPPPPEEPEPVVG